ncbi:uncharacterized protein LOC135804549 [Sycon ciliatum]|uniref:uncharacterized protein LOC135804549 n=1 Tax=Sycon ciliatum TaxID=27933 RepID=UPI0031F719A2
MGLAWISIALLLRCAAAMATSEGISCEGNRNGNCFVSSSQGTAGGGAGAMAVPLSSLSVQSTCDVDSAYSVPSASRPGAFFRSAVLNDDNLPFNGSVRRLLQDWYYHGNLTSGAVASAAAGYATSTFIIASVVFALALILPMLGAVWQAYARRKADEQRTRTGWSRDTVLTAATMLFLAAGALTLVVVAMLASFNSRSALNDVGPVVTADLKQLDHYVSSTVRSMNRTLVGRGKCLADYVDKGKQVDAALLEHQVQQEERLLGNLSEFAPSASPAIANLSALAARLTHAADALRAVLDQHMQEANEMFSSDTNITELCLDESSMRNVDLSPENATDTNNTDITGLCEDYAQSKNLSEYYENLLEGLTLSSEMVCELLSCMNASNVTGQHWNAQIQTLSAMHNASASLTGVFVNDTLDSTNGDSSPGADWLRSVKSSMQQAMDEGQEFLNSTLGLPGTYSKIDDMMSKHIGRYEDYRHVLSVMLLICTMAAVLSMLVLALYGFVLLRCQDHGRASVELSERLTLIGRLLERLVTCGYILLVIIFWTAGWFFIGASLLGSTCGENRNMTAVLANVVDNPNIWHGDLPLARQVLRNASSEYPLTASGVLADCRSAGESSVWRALHLEYRQPLDKLTGSSANFGSQSQESADALEDIRQHLRHHHHRCLNGSKLKSLQAMGQDILTELGAVNGSRDRLSSQLGDLLNAGESIETAAALLHNQRHSVHILINHTAQVISSGTLHRGTQQAADQHIERFARCTSDMITQPGQCQNLPCLYQSTTRAMCGDYLSAVDVFWFYCFWSGVVLWINLLVVAWISRKYFIEPQPVIHDFSSPKAMAIQLTASLLFGAAWILDLMVTIEFYHERSSGGMGTQSMWLVAVVLLAVSGAVGLLVRAVCWVLVDRASGSTDLGEQRGWIHRRHGWQFLGDLSKLILQDIPFFALLVAYCHRNHYVGTVAFIAMILAVIGICYFFVFALLINWRNTRRYISWTMSSSRGKHGKYRMTGLSPSPVPDETTNGIHLRSATRIQRLATLTVAGDPGRSDDEVYESDADQLERAATGQDGSVEVLSTSIQEPRWTAEPEMHATSDTMPPVVSSDTNSDMGTLERRRNTPALRSTTPIRPAKVAPAPTITDTAARDAVASTSTTWTRAAATAHYTSGPRSDMTSRHSTSSVSSAGNGRPTSTAMTLDQLLSEWDASQQAVSGKAGTGGTGGTGGKKRTKYATWSEAPPAHLMAAIEQEMSGHSQLEGTTTFCTTAAPPPIIEEVDGGLPPPPPEAMDALFTLDSNISYAARTASLPTSDKARKRYERRLMASGTAGPNAERIRQNSVGNGVLVEDQLADVEYLDFHEVKSSSLSIDV